MKKKERLVKGPDGRPLPIIAPNDIADLMEHLGKEITRTRKGSVKQK